jgi:hypothetical protein
MKKFRKIDEADGRVIVYAFLDFNDAFGCKIRGKVCVLLKEPLLEAVIRSYAVVIATMGNTSASAAIIKTTRAVAAPVRSSGWG